MSAGAARAAGPPWYRTERLHGAAWLAWRQNRWLVGTSAAVVALVAAVLGYQAHQIDAAAAGPLGTRCGPAGADPFTDSHGIGSTCGNYFNSELRFTSLSLTLVQLGLTVLPVLVGMFVGAPLLSREYERRTHLLVWSQSVSPTRWLAARLGAAVAVVGLATVALTGMSDWFWHDQAQPRGTLSDYRYDVLAYASSGLMPVAYSLYTLALGAVVGLLLRRALLAIGVTGLLAVLTDVVLYQLRPHLYPAVNGVQPFSGDYDGFLAPPDAWVVSSGQILPNGTRITTASGCDGCANPKAYYGSYQPASHFWPLQSVEAGILLALALALFGLVLYRVRGARR
ncbi:hypothetical protein [Streptacidiphilus sp. P02-A3a]|uniref:hypothetical protein n=1 Tax=Streptacidiphilus sp. P02-A3a TaxID=2704468 RepID=UPI0015FD2EB5|nr:hypothetical protein [Streptacidiphilus sp. P02-A3a]QMU69244.1 hypothetical protein GXP74_14305 [Streptacidiphilus sp. P02-A3a]